MSRLRNHPCVPILLVQQPEEGLCVCCLPLFAVRWVYRKVTTPFSSHVSWPVPQYSQQAGRGGGSASKASAVRSGSLSAAVALLHRQNSERQQSQLGKKRNKLAGKLDSLCSSWGARRPLLFMLTKGFMGY